MDGKKETTQLAAEVKSGSQSAFSELEERYRPMIRNEVSARCGRVAFDDLYQEAMIALFAAASAFDPDRGVTFGAFARVCVCHRLDSALRRGADPVCETLSDEIGLCADSPEAALLADESYGQRLRFIDGMLTDQERSAFMLYLEGLSYRDIASRLGRTPKSVDGALRRSKEKLRRAFQ